MQNYQEGDPNGCQRLMRTNSKLLSFLYPNKELNRYTQLQEKENKFTRMWGTPKGGLRQSKKNSLVAQTVLRHKHWEFYVIQWKLSGLFTQLRLFCTFCGMWFSVKWFIPRDVVGFSIKIGSTPSYVGYLCMFLGQWVDLVIHSRMLSALPSFLLTDWFFSYAISSLCVKSPISIFYLIFLLRSL